MKIFIRGLVIAGLCAGFTFAVNGNGSGAATGASGSASGSGPVNGSVGGTGTTSVPTSNGTLPSTNPSSVGSPNTPPEVLGGGVGTGNVSKTGGNTSRSNLDYQNTVRLYGANSEQAKAARAHQQNSATSKSRATGITNTGQTYPTHGTFTPEVNSGAGAAGVNNAANSGAGLSTGNGAGNAASTNGSPTAHY